MCCVVASPQHQSHPQKQVVHATTPTPHQLQHNPQVDVVHHALQPLCFFMVVVQWWVCCMVDAIVLALSHRCCAFWCVVVHPISPSPLTHHLVHPSHTHWAMHTHNHCAIWCHLHNNHHTSCQSTTHTHGCCSVVLCGCTSNNNKHNNQWLVAPPTKPHTNHHPNTPQPPMVQGFITHACNNPHTPHAHKTHTPCRFAPPTQQTPRHTLQPCPQPHHESPHKRATCSPPPPFVNTHSFINHHVATSKHTKRIGGSWHHWSTLPTSSSNPSHNKPHTPPKVKRVHACTTPPPRHTCGLLHNHHHLRAQWCAAKGVW